MEMLLERLDIMPYTGTSGVYSAVIPDERSKKVLRAVAGCLDGRCNDDKLHCSVIYSPEKTVSGIEPSSDTFAGSVTGIECFGPNKNHVVVTMESDSLQAEHKRFLDAGAEHTFTPYAPHVTLFKLEEGEQIDEEFKQYVEDIIKGSYLVFNSQFIGDISE